MDQVEGHLFRHRCRGYGMGTYFSGNNEGQHWNLGGKRASYRWEKLARKRSRKTDVGLSVVDCTLPHRVDRSGLQGKVFPWELYVRVHLIFVKTCQSSKFCHVAREMKDITNSSNAHLITQYKCTKLSEWCNFCSIHRQHISKAMSLKCAKLECYFASPSCFLDLTHLWLYDL